MSRFHGSTHVFAVTVCLLSACTASPESPTASASVATASRDAHGEHAPSGNGTLPPAQHQAVADVRSATSRFHDIAVAKRAGYSEQFPAGCAASPDGAQGIHYLNNGLVDGTVELLKPELVMYEPRPNGSLQLIGVDYVVPFEQWTAAEPPQLLGVPFMRNEPLGVWALHIWAWRPNPSGMFAAWNPKVSCAHASAVAPQATR